VSTARKSGFLPQFRQGPHAKECLKTGRLTGGTEFRASDRAIFGLHPVLDLMAAAYGAPPTGAPPVSAPPAAASAPVSSPPAAASIPSRPGAGRRPGLARFVRDFRATALAAGIARRFTTRRWARSPAIRAWPTSTQPAEFASPVWSYLTPPSRLSASPTAARCLSATPPSWPPSSRNTACRRKSWFRSGATNPTTAEHGPFHMFEALATLAYDGPRTDYAAAIDRGAADDAAAEIRRGRYDLFLAGAFGQTQFVPTTFLGQAVDGDGDGRSICGTASPTRWPPPPT